MIPTGDDPAIKLGHYHSGDLRPLKESERQPLLLLRDFVEAVATFRRVCKADDARIKFLLTDGKVAQMIVSEDDAWYQAYVQ